MIIKVLLVDDHDIVRTGIKMVLEKMSGIEVVGECKDGREAVNQVVEKRPDVVLMDINMPVMSGLQATRKIAEIDDYIKVIILTIHAQNPLPKQMLDAGAAGYLTKGCAAAELELAIRQVYAGNRYVCNDIAQQMLFSNNQKPSPFDALASREMEVAMLLVRGKKPDEIARALELTPKTVATYKYRVLDKLEMRNDIELTHLAIRHGILDSQEIGLVDSNE